MSVIRLSKVLLVALAVSVSCVASVSNSNAQSYGIELHNTLMPVSGAMGGASIARPQDFLSALNGNPASLTQFGGTHFTFGGAWAEGTYNIDQLAPLPLVGVDPFDAKSGTPGASAGNIGVSQELSLSGMPVVFGLGLITNAGAGVDFRGIPESNGTSAQYMALDMVAALAMPITEQLSAGSAVALGSSFLDGPFTDTGGMTPAYTMRGTLGVNYALHPATNIGAYYQTKKNFEFEDAAVINGVAYDVRFDHPRNFGVGIADESLMGGRLLIATDVIYKNYQDTDFLKAIYEDQWVWQTGLQYTVGPKVKLRFGYSYNTNPMRDAQATSIGGVPIPDGIPGLRYIQGQFAAIPQHHLTGGIGIANVLPGIDIDMLAGGMFEAEQQFATTIASVESYWIGSYLTWRFGGAKDVSK
jgi:long-chain fatty acid transport protein